MPEVGSDGASLVMATEGVVALSRTTTCPACRKQEPATLRRAAAVERDLGVARRLWSDAVTATHEPPVRVTLDRGDDVLRCGDCGTLWRRHAMPADGCDGRYLHDKYGAATLQRIWARCMTEYEGDRAWLTEQGLGPGVRILEVGTYAGAFLAFAGSLGCEAVGVDVSREAVAWAQGRGVDARLGPLRRGGCGPERFDQVWVLNCFEQVPDPDAFLAEIHAVLRDDGRLVLRTPNGAFVALAYGWPLPGLKRTAVANHVFGIPFLHCYTTAGIRALFARNGFSLASARGRPFAVRPTAAAGRVSASRVGGATRRLAARLRPDAADPWIDVVGVRARQCRST
jgi:SAM-dependent methyltransferase